MPIGLDHTIVPSRDQEAGAKLFAKLFGLTYEGKWGHFSPVKVNDLSMDWDSRETLEPSSQCPRAAGEWCEEVRGGRRHFDA